MSVHFGGAQVILQVRSGLHQEISEYMLHDDRQEIWNSLPVHDGRSPLEYSTNPVIYDKSLEKVYSC